MSIGLLNKENQGQYRYQESHKLTRPHLTKPYVATQSKIIRSPFKLSPLCEDYWDGALVEYTYLMSLLVQVSPLVVTNKAKAQAHQATTEPIPPKKQDQREITTTSSSAGYTITVTTSSTVATGQKEKCLGGTRQ